MKNRLIIIFGLISVLIACQQNSKEVNKKDKSIRVKEITFYTSDSIRVFGDLYEIDKKAATILLFHQGGANAKGEYKTIIPELIKRHFNILAIDQRLGGQLYGKYNRTVADISYNDFSYNYTYCDVYADMEGALNFIIDLEFSKNIIVWGSSYSASLAIQLASKHQNEISGVLAFSPASRGMQDCRPDEYFKTIQIPLLLLRPSKEMEIESARNQFSLAQQFSHQVYVAEYGTHGSSMLVEERVKNKVSENWKIVLSFLDKLKNK